MYQPSSLFESIAENGGFLTLDQEQLSQADFQELFGPGTPEEDVFSSSSREGYEQLDFAYESVSLATVDSVSSSAMSTPDLSNYSFGQHWPAFPASELDKPRPCSSKSQRAYAVSTSQQALSHRPRHIRQHTNDVHLHAPQLPLPELRRRSLSHSDIDRIASSARIPNPTFVRLQAPRFRATTPEKLQRGESGSYCGRNVCHSRGRSMEPTGSPYSLHSSTFICGMLPTPIGTPLNEVEDTYPDFNTLHRNYNMTTPGLGFPQFSRDPIFRQMSRPEELARSQQIIEIGALAVTNHGKVGLRLESCESIPNRDLVLRKLVDNEEHVKKAGGVEALRSCKTIRKVLTRKTECEDEKDVVDEVLNDDTDASRNTTVEMYADVFDGRDDDEIMASLMKEYGAEDISVV